MRWLYEEHELVEGQEESGVHMNDWPEVLDENPIWHEPFYSNSGLRL